MSFILDDKDLINQLLKHGADFESQFTKSGQAAAAQSDANAALMQLLNGLESQLNPPAKDPNAPIQVSTELDTPVPLTSTALEGLGALVAFLAQNKITVEGQRISYYQQEDPKSEDYQLYRLEPNAGFLEPANRQTVTNGYFVNKDLLVKYITTLQASLAKKPNDVLRVQLGALVGQANKLLGTKLGTEYKEPERTLADNQPLDTFPQVIDPRTYGADGPVQLTFGDIKSAESFNAWMQSKNITVAGKTMKDQDFDTCAVIQTVHSKARWLLSRSTSADAKSRNTIYVKQVEEIGPSITGPDGKACALTGVSSSQTAGTGGAAAEAASFDHVVGSLPLRAGDIDFSRIKDFFTNYRALLNANTQQRPDTTQVFNAMNNAEQNAMPHATAMTENQMEIFPLSVDVTTLATWLIPPKGQTQANSLINNLRYVISQTAAVIGHFKNHYQSRLSPQQVSIVRGQIGDGAESAGYAGVNLNHLEIWGNAVAAQTPAPPNTNTGWKARGY